MKRKLRLSAETLRVLSESQARRVAGGGTDEENPCEETGQCTMPSWCDGCGATLDQTCWGGFCHGASDNTWCSCTNCANPPTDTQINCHC